MKDLPMQVWLKRLLGIKPKRTPIIIVSGLPRSGTSMLMRMLEAGGLPPLTDKLRTADTDNPEGYYEFERVKQLDKGDTTWLATAQGHAVKVISALLQHLPATYDYKVIFVERQMAEILASQRKMLAHRQDAKLVDENKDAVDDAQMTALFEKHLRTTRQWLAQQPNFTVRYIHYSDLLREPATQAAKIHQFLENNLDVEKMAGVIDPTLYRNRA
jgi:hypothetical protein